MILSYARVSTPGQDEEGATSISEQQRKIAAVAQLRGVSDYGIQTFSDVISGSTHLRDRPQGGRMIKEAKAGDVIIAAKLDRLFRSASDALVTVEWLQERKIEVILIDIGVDPVTSNGAAKMFFSMLAAFAEFERGRILERVADGRAAKVRRKGFVGGAPPYGYRIVGEGRDAMLEPIEDEQKIVALIFELGQRHSPSGIVKELNERKILTRVGMPWQITQVTRIMDRERKNKRLGITNG